VKCDDTYRWMVVDSRHTMPGNYSREQFGQGDTTRPLEAGSGSIRCPGRMTKQHLQSKCDKAQEDGGE